MDEETFKPLQDIPCWAAVAFAVRCSRSVRYLWQNRLAARDLDCAINFAELLARQGGNGSEHRSGTAGLLADMADDLVMSAARVTDDESTLEKAAAGDIHAANAIREASAVCAAAHSIAMAARAAQHAASTREPSCGPKYEPIAQRERRRTQAIQACATESFFSAIRAVSEAGGDSDNLFELLRRDAYWLAALGKRENWDDQTPVHLSLFSYYSCFISYSVTDEEFVSTLHSKLVRVGVHCWKWNHDALGGRSLWGCIESGIQANDTVLLVVSRAAIQSSAVGREIELAMKKRSEALAPDSDLAPPFLPIFIEGNILALTASDLKDSLQAVVYIDAKDWRDHVSFTCIVEEVLRALRVPHACETKENLSLVLVDDFELSLEEPPNTGLAADAWRHR